MITYDQFTYEAGDIDKSLPASREHSVAIIAALVAIEAEHPGTLEYILRTAALTNANFRIKTNCSNPSASLKAQEEIKDWIQWFEDNNLVPEKGGAYES